MGRECSVRWLAKAQAQDSMWWKPNGKAAASHSQVLPPRPPEPTYPRRRCPLRGSHSTPSPLASPCSYHLSGVCTPAEPPVPVEQRLYFLPWCLQRPVGCSLSLCSVTGKGRDQQDPSEDESCASWFTPLPEICPLVIKKLQHVSTE